VEQVVCESDGVRFRYPKAWEFSRETRGRDVTFHLQTGGTAFWSLTLLAEKPLATEAVDAAVQAFREEYPEVDLYDSPDWLVEGPTAGCELDFVYVDLVNSAVIRAEITSDFTVLVVYQAETRELEAMREVLSAVTSSVQFSGDDAANVEP
jgi:hypothetical protein